MDNLSTIISNHSQAAFTVSKHFKLTTELTWHVQRNMKKETQKLMGLSVKYKENIPEASDLKQFTV